MQTRGHDTKNQSKHNMIAPKNNISSQRPYYSVTKNYESKQKTKIKRKKPLPKTKES